MVCIIEMEPAINLANLPPDIIGRIVRMDPGSVDSMQLISRSWNTVASDRENRPPLERLYLCPGVPVNAYEVEEEESAIRRREDQHWDREKRRRQFLARAHVSMYAVMTDAYSRRFGIGGWLSIFRKYEDGAVEVTCAPQKISACDPCSTVLLSTSVLLLIITPFIFFNPYYDYAEGSWKIGAVFSACLVLIIVLSLLCLRGPKEKRTRAKLARFFASFSRIETLVLDNYYSHIVDTILLKSLEIKRLEVRGRDLCKYSQKKIIKMCRAHSIRHVFITTRKLEVANFKNFAFELSGIGASLDVYEISCSQSPLCLGQSRGFWDEMTKELRECGISMRIATVHDDYFRTAGYDFGVKSHWRCEKSDECNDLQLRPVQQSRGFSI